MGYNYAKCQKCEHVEWFGSSCGNRHCPKCLGPRQAQWAQKTCERLPDCPHFHVVFTVPSEFDAFYALNYKVATELLFEAAAETLKQFQKNNWGVEGGFFGVLHTWGSALNWHPHLHMLVSAGGRDLRTGRWKATPSGYLFPVRSMSKVFRGIILRRLEELEASTDELDWPEGLERVDDRRLWRRQLARRNWNIFSRATLGNTRAVVRYLARYTSRIALSNQRILAVDEEAKTVRFKWRDYRDEGKLKEMTLGAHEFIRRFASHLVPKGLRRIRNYGLLVGKVERWADLAGAPSGRIGERAAEVEPRECPQCESDQREMGRLGSWRRLQGELPGGVLERLAAGVERSGVKYSLSEVQSFSLLGSLGRHLAARDGPVQQGDDDNDGPRARVGLKEKQTPCHATC